MENEIEDKQKQGLVIRAQEPESWLPDMVTLAFDKEFFDELNIVNEIKKLKVFSDERVIWTKINKGEEQIFTISKNRRKTTNIMNKLMLDCGLPIKYASEIETALQDVSQFLLEQKIANKIKPESFIDPEFPEWKMLKISIEIDADLIDIYEKFKEPIYGIFNSKLTEQVIENLMIKFEKLN